MMWLGNQCVANCGAGTHIDPTTNTCLADVTCGNGTVAMAGSCVASASVCGTGTMLSGTTCVPDDTCGPGTHDAHGLCLADDTCGNGTHDLNGKCVQNEGCGPGTHDSNGMCVPDDTCGSGTHNVNGQCVPNDTCGTGTHDVNGTCVPDDTCGTGTHSVAGRCVPNDTCGTGTHDLNGVCVPDDTCGNGTHNVNGQCVPNDTCGTGTHDVNGQCMPNDTCGTGTHDVNGQCVTNSACGTGTHLDSTSNSCLPDVTCGKFTRVVNGQCVVDLGGHGPTQWSKNVQVSSTKAPDGSPLLAFEPQIAVAVVGGSPSIAIAYPTGFVGGTTSQVVVSVSQDGGATFPFSHSWSSTDSAFNSPAWLGDPTITAFGADVYLAFIVYRTSGCASGASPCGELDFDHSSDGGVTWDGPTILEPNNGYLIDRPFWAQGYDGNTYLSFTWDGIESDGTQRRDTFLFKTDTNGQLNLMRNALGLSIDKTYGLRVGAGFGFLSQAPVVANSAGTIFGTVDRQPTAVYDTHRVDVVAAPNSDATPFAAVTVRDSSQSRENDLRNLDQWLAMNSTGDMVLLWRTNISGGTHIASTVTTSQKFDSGLWTGSLVDDSPVGMNADHIVVVADANSKWHALWQDDRYGAWATFYASSSDGRTWSANSFVSDLFYSESGPRNMTTGNVQTMLGDFNSIAASGGKLYAAWVDTRNGISQVFFSTAKAP